MLRVTAGATARNTTIYIMTNSAHNATAFTADTGADGNKQRHKQYMGGGNDHTKVSGEKVGMSTSSEDSIVFLFEKSKPKPSSPGLANPDDSLKGTNHLHNPISPCHLPSKDVLKPWITCPRAIYHYSGFNMGTP